MCRAPCQALCTFILFHPLSRESGSSNYSHSADEETKAQGGWVTCLRSRSQQVTQLGLERGSLAAEPVLMSATPHSVWSPAANALNTTGHGMDVACGSVC